MPPLTVMRMSSAVAVRTICSPSDPIVRMLSVATAMKSHAAPGTNSPTGRARLRAPPVVRAAMSSAGENRPRWPLRSRSPASSPCVSRRASRTTCWSEPSAIVAPASASSRAGPMPSARSASVHGHMTIVVPPCPSVAMSASDRCVAWTGESVSLTTPARARTCVGVVPYAATDASFSAGCSERWTCSGPDSSVKRGRSAAATARTEWIAAPRWTKLSPGAPTGNSAARSSPRLACRSR